SANDLLAGGAQDNGTVRQKDPNLPLWGTLSGGDGQFAPAGGSGATRISYTGGQDLGQVTKNTQVAGPAPHPTELDLEVNGTGPCGDDDLVDVDPTVEGDRRFEVPYAINAVDPQRFLIGTEALFEEDPDDILPKRGDDVSLRNGKANLVVFGKGTLPESARIGAIQAIAYGGF